MRRAPGTRRPRRRQRPTARPHEAGRAGSARAPPARTPVRAPALEARRLEAMRGPRSARASPSPDTSHTGPALPTTRLSIPRSPPPMSRPPWPKECLRYRVLHRTSSFAAPAEMLSPSAISAALRIEALSVHIVQTEDKSMGTGPF